MQDSTKSQAEYLKKLTKAESQVAKVLELHPEFDKSDLFHIALKQFETAESKWASGIRRRLISNVFTN